MSQGIAELMLAKMSAPVPSWMSEGNCTQAPVAMFGTAANPQVCSGCPVVETCLAYAKERGVTNGVWGGRDFSTEAEQS